MRNIYAAFGTSVSVTPARVAVGAPATVAGAAASSWNGAVYVFE